MKRPPDDFVFFRIKPDGEQGDEGWRYRLSMFSDDGPELVEECVPVDRLEDPNAHFDEETVEGGRINLSLEEARWLRAALDDLIAHMETE